MTPVASGGAVTGVGAGTGTVPQATASPGAIGARGVETPSGPTTGPAGTVVRGPAMPAGTVMVTVISSNAGTQNPIGGAVVHPTPVATLPLGPTSAPVVSTRQPTVAPTTAPTTAPNTVATPAAPPVATPVVAVPTVTAPVPVAPTVNVPPTAVPRSPTPASRERRPLPVLYPRRDACARRSGHNPPGGEREQHQHGERHPECGARQYPVTPDDGGCNCGVACPDDQAKDG